MHILFDMK